MKFGQRNAIATTMLVAVVVIVIVIVIVGAYVAVSGGAKTVTSVVTSGTTSISVVTSGVTSTVVTSSSAAPSVTLNGAGSTLVFPLMSSWTYNYTILNPNVRINYASVGSGAGIAQITAKTVNFGASDAPLSAAQYGNLSSQGILQIPEIAGAVVPAYNLPGIGTGLKFNGTVLADIYLGKITTWNDPALQQLNPGVNLPNNTIFVVHRSDGSGTTYVWTDYLSHASSVWNTTVGKATSVSWPAVASSIGAKGSEGVSGVIQGNKYSLGYMESAYATSDKLTYGEVQNAAGNFILANSTTAAAAVAAAASEKLPAGNQSWTSVSIVDTIFTNTTATNAYPITTFTYIMVYKGQTNQVTGQALVNFLWWIINTNNAAAGGLGYIPLPASVVAIDDATISSMNYNGQAFTTPPM
jgi:phosphate transport system substrate-binding protein